MRRYPFIAFLFPFLVCLAFSPVRADDGEGKCESSDVQFPADRAYREKTCRGERLEKEGRYGEAAEAYQAALDMDLFEVPNFELLPRLALMHHMAGDEAQARETLEEAKLALQVMAGAVVCYGSDGTTEFHLKERSGARLPDSPLTEKVMNRMCGAMYEGTYGNYTSLEGLLADAKLVEEYYSVEGEVSPGDRGR
ncbi:hypothetical protein [Parvibaculum sp.]|uniref:hypothetical protein n=1 Tax=Parvibaculum sp. TaxID=2024848 RepID=UPI001B21F3F3|nr:hypothetical protein [Parvibaculum sp.]MBO6634685.1 hypothetical protein [Parvibaculum sp.]MBO6680249.1 hypothetical protein [Parvibaculum sp.]MBO6685188.1 hypothetical protein [Parvibaculum sp.]MBO6905492.1 hypothetical protein [Parvibaculum sp.]